MALFKETLLVMLLYVWSIAAYTCPEWRKFGPGPPASCTKPSDPQNLPPSALEQWLTREVFEDLFPKANIGWGPNSCWPYSYDAFVIAARYFPNFGTSSPNTVYTAEQNMRRDVAAFFAHAVQETGENDASLYSSGLTKQQADDCFYRGGFFNWFEGGPVSAFLNPSSPGYSPADGNKCNTAGRYCSQGSLTDYFYPCKSNDSPVGGMYEGCYFGRGAVQISYNYNYGQFGDFLKSKGINVDLLNDPNLVMTKMDPPLAIMASLWFYMTPQPPKPSMHDIVLGEWYSGATNKAAGYTGPIFGPTSLIINNECGGEDAANPGGPGESRRIKAFKWFCKYFGVPYEADKLLTCKDMPQKFDAIPHALSYQPDWSSTWKEETCSCAPANYGGLIPYFDSNYYPDEFVALNAANRQRCVESLYGNPAMYGMAADSSPCLKYPPSAPATTKKATTTTKKVTTVKPTTTTKKVTTTTKATTTTKKVTTTTRATTAAPIFTTAPPSGKTCPSSTSKCRCKCTACECPQK